MITSSRNADEDVADLLPLKVDGNDSGELALAGKPEPGIFLEVARRLGVLPEQTGVVEDATSGVEAGCRVDFGLIAGVDGSGQAE